MERRTFIKTFVLSSGAMLIGSQNFIGSILDEKTIKILMIYNNIGDYGSFINEWGLSIWIEDKDNAVLFDAGGNPSTIWKNITKSGIDINKLSKIVISHNHWDHVNGLPRILEKTNYKPQVYVPDFDLENIRAKNPKAKFTGIINPTQINEYICTTGQLKKVSKYGIIHEQSIIITQRDSIFLLTGCSHPGIVEIVEKAKEIHPNKKLGLVGGGFHLLKHSEEQVKEISAKLKNLHVMQLAPSHCTGERAINILKEEWGDKFIDFNNGNNMNL